MTTASTWAIARTLRRQRAKRARVAAFRRAILEDTPEAWGAYSAAHAAYLATR